MCTRCRCQFPSNFFHLLQNDQRSVCRRTSVHPSGRLFREKWNAAVVAVSRRLALLIFHHWVAIQQTNERTNVRQWQGLGCRWHSSKRVDFGDPPNSCVPPTVDKEREKRTWTKQLTRAVTAAKKKTFPITGQLLTLCCTYIVYK